MNISFASRSPPPQSFSLFSPIFIFVLLVIFVFIIIYIYHTTIGYYISYGWKSFMDLISKKEDVEVDIELGDESPQTLLKTKIKPYDAKKEKDDFKQEYAKLQEIRDEYKAKPPSNIPTDSIAELIEIKPTPVMNQNHNQMRSIDNTSNTVFNISQNVYTYYDAPAVCKAFNSTLATYQQVKEAYNSGADWCNYGWIEGQQAVFPTQKTTFDKLQRGKPELKKSCGKPGINGGYFDNPELRFGVNCYGIRPAKNIEEESQVAIPPSADDIEFEKKVQRYRDSIDKITLSPFSHPSCSNA